MATDLSTFKPDNADDLMKELLGAASDSAGAVWNKMKDEIKDQLTLISTISLKTAANLAAGDITKKQADHTLHLLEFNLNTTMLLAEIIPFAVADAVLNAVFNVINAVVKNYSGIDFGFGRAAA